VDRLAWGVSGTVRGRGGPWAGWEAAKGGGRLSACWRKEMEGLMNEVSDVGERIVRLPSTGTADMKIKFALRKPHNHDCADDWEGNSILRDVKRPAALAQLFAQV
jgi:hypothetical protein